MIRDGMFLQGRYEIVGKIGTGGMADVYKARDHKLNRFVAIKVLKSEFRADKAFITKFRAEAQAAAGLAHPNIVNVYDVGEDRNINFIVMELVEGITLKEYIAKKGKLAVREATSIAIQVSQGLEAAHNSGIIHRDVKPQNIIISTDGKVKVTDFGIARVTTSNTINTAVMGSVHYSSPEQARGGYSDAKSDIYSLGITMYEMLTGHVPFDGDSTVAIAIKHLQEEMKSPEVYVPDLPKSTVQIIRKCTQKSPDRRYANMTALIYDLKESLVNPDGDFVQIDDANPAGRTVVISKKELGAIKDSYLAKGSEPDMTEGSTNVARNPYEQQNGAPYEPYSRAYGNRGYDYREDMQNNHQDYQEEEEEDGILSPKLEKLMTVGSIVIAILIAGIFLGLIANALGLVRFSMPSIFGGTSGSSSVTTESKQETTEQSSTTATGATETQTTEAQTQTTQTTEAQTQTTQTTEAQTTESETEEVDVPDVEGMDIDTATATMMSAGFYVERQDEASDAYAADTVIDQSVIGTAKPGTTVILIVSTGSSDGNSTSSDEVWACSDVQLAMPDGYSGQPVRLILQQSGVEDKVILDGQAISFPYDLYVEGQAGISSGDVYLYVYNESTGQYEAEALYTVPFSRVR